MRLPANEQREVDARNRNIRFERSRAQVDAKASIRHEIALLAPEGCVGLEAGVDTGQFTERLWNTGRFSTFHAVDKWNDRAHSEAQYWAVCEKLMKYEEIRIWRLDTQMFSTLCPKDKFGFIYIDCYAHTGQDGGGVLEALWPLLQEGGIFAGDDYDELQWSDNFRTINEFAEQVGKRICVYDKHLTSDRPKHDNYASWYFTK